MSALDNLGHAHGTDKRSGLHDYLSFYETFLARLRDKPITILEMGAASGNSLRMWCAYFPLARVIGVDNDPRCAAWAEDRIAIEIGDQSSVMDLDRIAMQYRMLDLIVDDCGHEPANQLLAYKTLLPYLSSGGVYLLEDIGVLEPWEDRSVGEFFADMARELAYLPQTARGLGPKRDLDPFAAEWLPRIATLAFWQKVVVTVLR